MLMNDRGIGPARLVQDVLMAHRGGGSSQGLTSWPDLMDRRRACGTYRRGRRGDGGMSWDG